MRTAILALTGALLAAGTANAAVVDVESLPYPGTPDWTDIVFDGTSMLLNAGGTEVTLATAPGRGVWFGNGIGYSNGANWSIGTAAEGNYLTLTAKFSAGAADWSAYMTDRSYGAAFGFGSTGCSDNCYALPAEAGIRVYHAGPSGQGGSTFVPLDITQFHTYEWLLRDGRVTYRVDAQVVHAGPAYAAAASNSLLVIGDGSGTNLTGLGSMTVAHAAFDAAPAIQAIPEPRTYALMAAGLGLVGWAARRARD